MLRAPTRPGQYRFDDVPAGDYGLSFVHDDPTFGNGAALGSQGREVNVSQGNVETVSVVLLPAGVQAPPVPADLEQRVRDSGGVATGYGGIMNNPFFWLWMFDRPWVFGYPRPPVVTTRPAGGPVTIDPNQAQPRPAPAAVTRRMRRTDNRAPSRRRQKAWRGPAPPRREAPHVRPWEGPAAHPPPGAAPSAGGKPARSRGQLRRVNPVRRRRACLHRKRRNRRASQAPRRVSVPRIRVPTRGFGGFRRCCTLGCCVGEYILTPRPEIPYIGVPVP